MTRQSAAFIFGFIVGVAVGFIISLPFRNIAILDGLVAGVMGGFMGVMLGVMIPTAGLYVVSALLVALFAFTWIVMYYRVYRNPNFDKRFAYTEGSLHVR